MEHYQKEEIHIKQIVFILSLVWFFWFYVWPKVKDILETNTEVDGRYVKEMTDLWLQGEIEGVKKSKSLSEEEKESLIRDLEYIHKRNYEGNHEIIAEEAGDKLEANANKFKILEFILIAIDSGLVLVPTILAYNGFVARSLILFVIISFMSAKTIWDAAEQLGITSTLDITLGTIISVILMHVQYIVTLVLLWMEV